MPATVNLNISPFPNTAWSETDLHYFTSDKSTDRLASCKYNLPAPLIINLNLGGKDFTAGEATPNKIIWTFNNNLGGNKVMITPWIAAHRAFHIIQFGIDSYHPTPITDDDTLFSILETIDQIFDGISSSYNMDHTYRSKPYYNLDGKFGSGRRNIIWTDIFHTIGTMRSARKHQLSSVNDIIAEFFAQYVITGSVTLNPFPIDNDTKCLDHIAIASQLDICFKQLTEWMVGRHIAL